MTQLSVYDELEVLREENRQLKKLLHDLRTVPLEANRDLRFVPAGGPRRIFAALVKAPGPVKKEHLHQIGSYNASETDPKMIDTYICILRSGLRKANAPVSINTIWGYGYEMVGDRARYRVPEIS